MFLHLDFVVTVTGEGKKKKDLVIESRSDYSSKDKYAYDFSSAVRYQ